MSDLTFDKIGDTLLALFPEFRERFERELGWWQGPDRPGQYIVFGFVVKPALLELLGPDKDTPFLRRLFGFFEEMARSSEIEVVNLLQVEILETLVSDKKKLLPAWRYMGEATKKVAQNAARIARLEENLPD